MGKTGMLYSIHIYKLIRYALRIHLHHDVHIHHVDAHMPKNCTTKDYLNNNQTDQAARNEVAQVDLDWE